MTLLHDFLKVLGLHIFLCCSLFQLVRFCWSLHPVPTLYFYIFALYRESESGTDDDVTPRPVAEPLRSALGLSSSTEDEVNCL